MTHGGTRLHGLGTLAGRCVPSALGLSRHRPGARFFTLFWPAGRARAHWTGGARGLRARLPPRRRRAPPPGVPPDGSEVAGRLFMAAARRRHRPLTAGRGGGG